MINLPEDDIIVFVVVNLFPNLWLYGLAANDNVLCNSARFGRVWII